MLRASIHSPLRSPLYDPIAGPWGGSEEAPAYTLWDGPGWFDASDTATITLSGGTDVASIANKRVGGGDLTYAGTAGNLDSIAAGQNGLHVLRLVRDVVGSRPRLSALVTDTISTMWQGDDKPYTVISAYKPTDTNTGFIWSASDTVDVTDAQVIALIRRSGSASSIRRALVTATPNDVSWGSGQASGTARIVAAKHSGTAVTVWDNSLTKAVDASAQNTTAFNSELIFRLFVSEGPSGSDPAYQATQCAMDFYEILVEDEAKSDADIQQAITDLATKWGITLS